MKNLLMIDDDEGLCRSIQLIMQTKGCLVRYAHTAEEGLAQILEATPEVIFLDLVLPDADGLEVLENLAKEHPGIPVVVISGRQDMAATITAMRHGAYDYLRKPFDVDDVELILEKARREYGNGHATGTPKPEPLPPSQPNEIVGSDAQMREVLKQIGRYARSRVNVLVHGESGTGKELVARAIHEASSAGKPFIAINCSAIVSTLLESELFGHEKGAFTGADRQKIGKLELAGEGTVFFDEIGDMETDLQAKLLRVLQDQRFERVGGNQSLIFRARAVFATHRNLAAMVREGSFREDLYYRVAVAEMRLPPLRERKGDIELLSRHFLQSIGRLGRKVEEISGEAMKQLAEYPWPGNVRELENVITRAIALTESPVLLPEHIHFLDSAAPAKMQSAEPTRPRSLADAEREHIQRTLDAQDWNITHTARILDISPTTLRKKIADYQLVRPSGH